MVGYRKFHGLSGLAFGKAIDRNRLLLYSQLTELEDELEELMVDGGIGLLTGDMGIGKTTALRHFVGGLEERAFNVAYQGSVRHATALLEGVVEALGVAPTRTRASLLRQLSHLVQRSWHEQRKKTLVILDDAHLVADDLLEDFRLSTNFGMDSEDPLVLLFVGHPALRLRLRRTVHLPLMDRVRTQYRLEGLFETETADYIDHHMQQAGGSVTVFTPDARSAIFEHSQGIPRRINALALLALKKSANRKVTTIDGAFITTVLSLMDKD